MQRIQYDLILNDLRKKMVFLAGPRQVGKTFLAKQLASAFQAPLYLNFDVLYDRKIIQEQSWLGTTDFLLFDELHKMPDWKNYLKGVFDARLPHQSVLVTGSARLEIFNQVGDSLAGRYYLHRLLPLSPAELKQLNISVSLDTLLEKGSFPEPFLANSLVEANRWRQQYINSLLTTDVFDFDTVQNIRALRNTFELLRLKVGSPISYQSLSEDIAVSPGTIKKYIAILEALYIIFRVTPFSKNIARSILKEPKIYFFDSGLVDTKAPGAQLENFVAVNLLKHVFAKTDYLAENYTLNYLRTKDQREVDFALVKDGTIEQIIELKNSNTEINKSLLYFHHTYNYPAIQLVKNIQKEYRVGTIEVRDLYKFLSNLYM